MKSTGGGLPAREKEMMGDISVREQKLWFELAVDVAVGLYFYPKTFALMAAGDAALTGKAMTGLIVGTVMWAVIVSGALALLFKINQKAEPKDERDHLIENTAGRWFGRVLVICLLALVGLIVVQAMAADLGSLLFTLTPLGIAILLLFSLMLASLVDSIAKLYCYRRGF
jgi:hypothetical protein